MSIYGCILSLRHAGTTPLPQKTLLVLPQKAENEIRFGVGAKLRDKKKVKELPELRELKEKSHKCLGTASILQ